MVDPLLFAITNVNLALRTVDGSRKLFDANNVENRDPGRVYDTVKKHMAARSHLSPSDGYSGTDQSGPSRKEAVEDSPAVRAIQNLFQHPVRRAVVNVMYDEPGTGKSMAGMSVLKYFYSLKQGEIQGFMVSTQVTNGLYVETFANLLGTSSVPGWFHAMLLAMDVPRTQTPSILVLDDFDLDDGGKNVQFIEHLYKCMNPPGRPSKNIVVVVLTQNKAAANLLCRKNGGQRIRPIDGYYDTKERDLVERFWNFTGVWGPSHILTHPRWIQPKWTKELLIDVLRFNFYDEQLSLLPQEFPFLHDGMTPYMAIQQADVILEQPKACKPTSPRKRGAQEGRHFF